MFGHTKIRIGDSNKAAAKMRSKPIPNTVKIPVSLNEVAVVRSTDLEKGIMHTISEFYRSTEIEGRIGIASTGDFAQVKEHLMELLGEKISCKLNVINQQTQIMEMKSYTVTLLKWTIPVLRYYNKPISYQEKNNPVRAVRKDEMISFSLMMKKMGADLPSRQIGEELRKDAEVKKLLANFNMDKFFTLEKSVLGEISLNTSEWKETGKEELLDANTGVLFVRLEKEPV